ncbi:organ-specific protein P4-like [Populus nigra]|uniref:organ-specific protein P4-like n=1 Tax=Populus nigra TaxID=3691 RepID=UPI002B274748|nr:organ-specific protein P4-like [Populus nigra]
MKSSFTLFVLFSLLLFANSINARKDIGGYWRAVMKDQSMPEAIQGLVHADPITALSTIKDSEPNPRFWIYDNGVESTRTHFFDKDFETRSGGSIHNDDEGKKHFAEHFEPRPDVFVNQDDALKAEKPFTEEFEPGPNISVYDNGVDKKPFEKDSEPKPSATAYSQ